MLSLLISQWLHVFTQHILFFMLNKPLHQQYFLGYCVCVDRYMDFDTFYFFLITPDIFASCMWPNTFPFLVDVDTNQQWHAHLISYHQYNHVAVSLHMAFYTWPIWYYFFSTWDTCSSFSDHYQSIKSFGNIISPLLMLVLLYWFPLLAIPPIIIICISPFYCTFLKHRIIDKHFLYKLIVQNMTENYINWVGGALK